MSRQHLGELLDELEPQWQARCEGGRHDRRGGARRRQAGAGPKYELTFRDQLVVTLVHLRTDLTQEALAVAYGIGSSTIGRAIGEVRPVLAARGFAVPDRAGLCRPIRDERRVDQRDLHLPSPLSEPVGRFLQAGGIGRQSRAGADYYVRAGQAHQFA
ncbi:transposase family protein [Streptomyces sp. NPDC005708]|uniref:helix-turn-helix domain-containing protein n=1 Tax=Streptomyces sp. NPDC005708 TaxID=3154564 RepID=UPI0033F87B2E